MAFPLSVPDKLGRSDIGDHGQAIIQDPGCVVITDGMPGRWGSLVRKGRESTTDQTRSLASD